MELLDAIDTAKRSTAIRLNRAATLLRLERFDESRAELEAVYATDGAKPDDKAIACVNLAALVLHAPGPRDLARAESLLDEALTILTPPAPEVPFPVGELPQKTCPKRPQKTCQPIHRITADRYGGTFAPNRADSAYANIRLSDPFGTDCPRPRRSRSWTFSSHSVSRSGYYAQLDREESERAGRDRRLLVLIRAFFEASDGNYGSPRVHRELLSAGERGWRSAWLV